MKIDKPKTLDRIRQHYPSVSAYARAYGVSLRTFHYALSGKRGTTDRPSMSRGVMERLEAEGLLVMEEDSGSNAANG